MLRNKKLDRLLLSWCLRNLASGHELFWTALTTRQKKKSIFPLLKNNRFVLRWFIGFWVSLKQIITPVHSKISTHDIGAQKMIGRRIEPRQKFYSCDNYGETWAESWIHRQGNQSSALTESHSLICASSHMLWQTSQTTVNFLLDVLLMGWERLQCLTNDLIP